MCAPHYEIALAAQAREETLLCKQQKQLLERKIIRRCWVQDIKLSCNKELGMCTFQKIDRPRLLHAEEVAKCQRMWDLNIELEGFKAGHAFLSGKDRIFSADREKSEKLFKCAGSF